MKPYRQLVLVLGAITAIAAAGATIALANSGTLSTTTILGHRATLADSARANQDGVKFQTKGPTDVLVQTITFQPQGNSGWHFHPGVVLVVVESGTVTTHDADCETRTYGPHSSFVESGTAPFMVSNESQTQNAVVYATLVVPAGSPFRIETAQPPCTQAHGDD
jgi:quercetin dioxygenase-like cupin family protein